MEIFKLDTNDLEYLKRTIEWMTEHMDLKDQDQDIEDLHNLTRNSLTTLDRGLEGLKNEAKATLPIDSVKPRFSEITKETDSAFDWLLKEENHACDSANNSMMIRILAEKYNEIAKFLNGA